MKSSQKGELAKLKVEQRAVELGWICSRSPEGSRYDLILDDGKTLHRVQVKYASSPFSKSKGAVTAGLRKNESDGRNLKYCRSKMKTYTRHEIDAVIIYVPQVNKLCWFGPKYFHRKTAISVRYEPPISNQTKTNMVSDFEW